VIGKAATTLILSGLAATYDGTSHAATASTNPSGLAFVLTYNGLPNAPISVGSYAVVATVNDPNYIGAASGTLVISKATAAVTLENLNAIYDGEPHAATVVTSPVGLTTSLTFDGSSSEPTVAGTYSVLATVNDTSYTGSATGVLAISKAPTILTLAPSSTSLNPGQNVTIRSTVVSPALTQPTGQVTLLDNGTSLGSFTLLNGASIDKVSLSPGITHMITAAYSGDVDFQNSPSNTISVVVLPTAFTFTNAGASEQIVSAGSSAGYVFALAPLANSPYPGQVNLAIDGLPTGATATFSPSSLSPNAGPNTVTLTVRTLPNPTNPMAVSLLPLGSLLLLSLLAHKRVRKNLGVSALTMVIMLGGLFVSTGLLGCGAGTISEAIHPLTVTATSGSIQQSTTVELVVR